ncbi:sporulation protein [Kangiella profundi]|uniref:Sporulation protein n=1 Tax=Kangiella profundi TaxID=1561924 RepID=A0A2K9B254_9GAMM|nr:SPOR domain-containing protein [Kangiella profundi]AUD78998.1 sporulation protein [Kangiella profundi]GGF02336.1 cell division protein DedD [Kangiella profundi]
MDEKLKYRLVGASVILALAVFFLPMILDSEKYRSQIQSQIPEVPSEHKSQYKDIENSSPNQQPEAQLDGPVEKGPLVINLDDNDENNQSAVTDLANKKVSETQVSQKTAEKQEPAKEELSNIDSSGDSAKTEPVKENTDITKSESQPKVETVAKTEAKPETKPESKPAEDISSKQTQQNAEVETTVKASESAVETELAFSDTAWLIQIGSFSNKDNATRLVGQLRDEGYRAYQRVGDSFARVYVGPYPVKGEAESRTSELEKMVGAKVKVIEFDPKQH